MAYWLSFGLAFINDGYSDVRWRFLLAFQCFPALLLLIGIKMLPDSPRYLASAGRYDEAREVLEHVRGKYDAEVEREFLEIKAVAETSSLSSPIEFLKILAGRGGKPGDNLAQRAWLCLFLQIMASWTGITAVTAYSPVLLSAAGYPVLTQNGLAGGLNTVGIVGTIISAQIVDKFGRRKCLMAGSLALFAVNLIAGAVYEAARAQPDKATQYAPAAVAMLFLFNISYAATWGTIAFLIPTEIWSSEMRAQGNGFGITGWAIGVGMTTLVNPIMFDVMENRTYFLFAGLNLLWIPVVFLCKFPGTATHAKQILTLEQFIRRRLIGRSSPLMPCSVLTASSTGTWRRTTKLTEMSSPNMGLRNIRRTVPLAITVPIGTRFIWRQRRPMCRGFSFSVDFLAIVGRNQCRICSVDEMGGHSTAAESVERPIMGYYEDPKQDIRLLGPGEMVVGSQHHHVQL